MRAPMVRSVPAPSTARSPCGGPPGCRSGRHYDAEESNAATPAFPANPEGTGPSGRLALSLGWPMRPGRGVRSIGAGRGAEGCVETMLIGSLADAPALGLRLPSRSRPDIGCTSLRAMYPGKPPSHPRES